MGITTPMDEALSSATQSQLIGYHRTPNHDIEIFQSVASVAPEWQILENGSNDPFSSRLWAESWYKAYKNKPGYEPVIILGKSKTGKPDFILPLVKKKFGPFNLLMRPGQKHSTYYHGLYSDEFRAQFAYKKPKAILAACIFLHPQNRCCDSGRHLQQFAKQSVVLFAPVAIQ